jgi:hypothetical protein
MLLDSQSACSVFKDSKLLTNIRRSPRTLRVCTNGGTQTSTKIGAVTNFGDVWCNPDSLANILSMAEVRRVCRIAMDTAQEAAITVHRKDGSLMAFRECKSGLHYFDTAPSQNNGIHNSASPDTIDYLFLNTVATNKLACTRRGIEGADRARTLLRNIGRPSESEFTDILKHNRIRNCPVTPDDACQVTVTMIGRDWLVIVDRLVLLLQSYPLLLLLLFQRLTIHKVNMLFSPSKVHVPQCDQNLIIEFS